MRAIALAALFCLTYGGCMTVPNETSRNDYVGNDVTTVFPYTYRILVESDLRVTKRDLSNIETILVLASDYTVSGVQDPNGGEITLTTALPSGYSITIRRRPSVTQTTDIRNGGAAFRSSIEDGLDKQSMVSQRFLEELDRCLKLAETEAGTSSLTLLPVDRAGMVLGFDAQKRPVAMANVPTGSASVSAFIQTLLDDADAQTARQTLLIDKKGSDIASAATINLTTATGDIIDVTGTTTITSITLAEGVGKLVRFTGALTLTHGASLVLPGAANIVTAAGDFAIFRGYAAGVVRCVAYQRAALPPDTPADATVTAAKLASSAVCHVFDGRLTLTSGSPVTNDVVGAGTIYLTPFKGNRLALFDGTNWKLYSYTERSLALPAGIGMYDIFVYDNAGVITLEALAWTNDTTRATALTKQDGVYVKTGATTHRYVGSIRTTAPNSISDRPNFRTVWNYYNRVARPMQAVDLTDSWNYTTAAFRQANNNANLQLNFVIGVEEDLVEADVLAILSNNNTGVIAKTGIGLDSTTVNSAVISAEVTSAIANGRLAATGSYKGFPGVGYHFLAWLEYSSAVGVTTWYGDDTTGLQHSGIIGMIWG